MVSTYQQVAGTPLDFRIAWSQVNHYVYMLLVLAAIILVGADEMTDTEIIDTANPKHATPRGLDATVDPEHGGRNVVVIRRGLDANAIASKLLERDATSAPVNDVDAVSSQSHAVLICLLTILVSRSSLKKQTSRS